MSRPPDKLALYDDDEPMLGLPMTVQWPLRVSFLTKKAMLLDGLARRFDLAEAAHDLDFMHIRPCG
jgi:hypothetical protein